jgi:hypothetical protein
MNRIVLVVALAFAVVVHAESPSPADGEKPIVIQYPNSDVADVLRFYASLTGTKISTEPGLSGKISIMTAHAIPRLQAISLIRDKLMQAGFEIREVSATEIYVSHVPVSAVAPPAATVTPTISPIVLPPPAP